jgi:two-component system LytT family sensor kinase
MATTEQTVRTTAPGSAPNGGKPSDRAPAYTTAQERSRRALWMGVVVVAFWSIPAWLITLLPSAERGDISVLRAFVAFGLPWYFWAAITPVVLRLTRRFPIDGPRRGRMIATHLAAGMVAGWTEGALSISAVVLTGARTPAPGFHAALIEMLFWTPFGVLFYSTLAAVGFALEYHRKLREREVLAARVEAQLVAAQLGALRMQLQPHFLFNVLHTVAMLVRQGQSQTAVRMLARLSDLLRQILDDAGPQEVPVEEELDLFARYLELEQIRFGDRLQINVAVDDSARGALVPNFLLQPLAENAIRHGVARRAAAGRIDLSTRCEAGRMIVRLRNDGPSLPAGWTLEENSGIGLRNTAARLRHLYGEESSLSVSNAAEGGVEVRIELPCHVRPVPLAEARGA